MPSGRKSWLGTLQLQILARLRWAGAIVLLGGGARRRLVCAKNNRQLGVHVNQLSPP